MASQHAGIAWPEPANAPVGPTSGAFLCDLPSYALLEISGADAEAFLQAQLSSDVHALDAGHSQLSTYNSPKGRVLATMLLWRNADSFLVQAAASLAPALLKRLRMYVLRAKVHLDSADDRYVRFGIAGEGADALLHAAGIAGEGADFTLERPEAGGYGPSFVLRLPGCRRELVFADIASAEVLWRKLRELGAKPASEAVWRWFGIRAGIADVQAATQDELVPQMLNYERLGAISFTKGCYPGQEIVARTQYRGGTSRRTFLLHADSELAPLPAQPVHAARAPDQTLGMVLDAAPAPGGGYDLLACLHVDLAAAGELRLGSGEPLRELPLPYALN
jgi:folate-binding protein YgfZ